MIDSTWFKTLTSLSELEKCFKEHLAELYANDGQHAKTLAQAVGILQTSFTPVLDTLQKRNLIVRKPDAVDRRAVYIHLTPKGRAYGETVTRIHEEVEAEYKS